MYDITISSNRDALWSRRMRLGGSLPSLKEAKSQLSALSQMLGVDYAPGNELKCDFEINGKPYSIGITGLFGTPIEYTPFEEIQ